MTSEQIQEMLSLGEGQRIEFKATTRNVDALGGVVCGFLNTSGGYLICGIQEPGKVVGVDASESTITKLEKQFHEGISPKSLVSVQVQELEGKPVIVIEVPAGKDMPSGISFTSAKANPPAVPMRKRSVTSSCAARLNLSAGSAVSHSPMWRPMLM